uniref:Candidate secreted effector n=1 Tax=Meloidogyne incognita TaxID=6306 RepID=A0A914M9V6_MELIC
MLDTNQPFFVDLAFLIVCFIMVTIEQKIEENNYVENDDDIFVTSNLEEENEKNNIFDGKNNDVDSSNGGWSVGKFKYK